MRLSDRCYAVTGLAYSTPWFVNAGFVVGDARTLIVDTGGNAASGDTVYGYAQAARPANALLAVNTERHFDHIGGNGVLRERGVEIWGHAEVSRTTAEFTEEVAEFNSAIPNQVRRERDEAKVFFSGTELTLPDRRIEREMRFDLGGSQAQVLLAPGHTKSNICVWVPSDKVLFSGDALVNGYLPNLESGGISDWRVWLESLARLRALNPESVVPGHGAVAHGVEVPRMFDAVIQALEKAIAERRAPTAPPTAAL
jgi:glyoxylase-like metal-dependent hydrolase (beta-lactamase superfamily II)